MTYFDTGGRIRETRESRRLTQEQLAELACLNRVTVAKYESGKVEPGAKALSKIADALEVSADFLLGRSEEVLSQAESPKTKEARTVSGAMDMLPKENRDQILNVVSAMLSNHPEIIKMMEGNDDDDSEL